MTPLLLAMPLVFAAPVPKELKAGKTDAELIVGLWETVETNINGNAARGSDGVQYRFEGGGKCTLLYSEGRQASVSCPFDATGSPKRYQWRAPWGTFQGVYELKGDTFTMALGNGSGVPAPAAVAPGPQVVYTVLRRVKE